MIFCEEQGSRLPVLNHRRDLELFAANAPIFTFYLGLRQQVCLMFRTFIGELCTLTSQSIDKFLYLTENIPILI